MSFVCACVSYQNRSVAKPQARRLMAEICTEKQIEKNKVLEAKSSHLFG